MLQEYLTPLLLILTHTHKFPKQKFHCSTDWTNFFQKHAENKLEKLEELSEKEVLWRR